MPERGKTECVPGGYVLYCLSCILVFVERAREIFLDFPPSDA